MTIILIMESHTELRKVIKGLLEEHIMDIEIIEANSRKEGVSKAIQQKPDLVLLDVNLPDMDGITLVERIKKDVPGTKIILLTMFVNKNTKRICKLNGVTAVLGKNDIFLELIPIIKTHSKKEEDYDHRNRHSFRRNFKSSGR